MVVDTMKPENRRVNVEPLRVSRNGRRFFSEAHKRAVVEKCLVPGASVSAVALAHGFNTNLVRKWIIKHQAARALARSAGALVPVSVIEAPATSRRASRRGVGKRVPEAASGWIEIEIGAARVILRGKVEAGQLRVVFDALGVSR
jgi:transposase